MKQDKRGFPQENISFICK